MDPTVIVAVLTTVRAAMEFIQAQQQGNAAAAVDALTGAIPPDADDHIVDLIELGQTALGYLAKRGVSIDAAVGLIEQAQTEQRDLTVEEVQYMLDQLQSELLP